MVPLLHFVIWLVLGATATRAQGPSIDIGGPPGIPEGRGELGRPIGTAGGSESIQHPATRTVPSAVVPVRPPAEPPSAA